MRFSKAFRGFVTFQADVWIGTRMASISFIQLTSRESCDLGKGADRTHKNKLKMYPRKETKKFKRIHLAAPSSGKKPKVNVTQWRDVEVTYNVINN